PTVHVMEVVLVGCFQLRERIPHAGGFIEDVSGPTSLMTGGEREGRQCDDRHPPRRRGPGHSARFGRLPQHADLLPTFGLIHLTLCVADSYRERARSSRGRGGLFKKGVSSV